MSTKQVTKETVQKVFNMDRQALQLPYALDLLVKYYTTENRFGDLLNPLIAATIANPRITELMLLKMTNDIIREVLKDTKFWNIKDGAKTIVVGLYNQMSISTLVRKSAASGRYYNENPREDKPSPNKALTKQEKDALKMQELRNIKKAKKEKLEAEQAALQAVEEQRKQRALQQIQSNTTITTSTPRISVNDKVAENFGDFTIEGFNLDSELTIPQHDPYNSHDAYQYQEPTINSPFDATPSNEFEDLTFEID